MSKMFIITLNGSLSKCTLLKTVQKGKPFTGQNQIKLLLLKDSYRFDSLPKEKNTFFFSFNLVKDSMLINLIFFLQYLFVFFLNIYWLAPVQYIDTDSIICVNHDLTRDYIISGVEFVWLASEIIAENLPTI